MRRIVILGFAAASAACSMGDGSNGTGAGNSNAAGMNGSSDMSALDAGSDAAMQTSPSSDASAENDAQGTASDGSSPGGLVYPPFAGNDTIDQGLAQLNAYRVLVGESTVTLDDASSQGCAAHLQYLICAAGMSGQMGYLEHPETEYPACAVDGGATAGVDSDLAWGESGVNGVLTGQSFGEAVDAWINGLYHRTPLLDPGLTKVGAAATQGYSCLDYNAPGNTVSMKAPSPVLFPPDGTTDVPLTFEGFEGPCPTAPSDPLTATTCAGSGFIISANWYGWSTGNGSAITAVASVDLTDTTAGADVPLLTWYADKVSGHDPAPGYVRNEIALVPQSALAQNHVFSVSVDATISGQATMLDWSFTTGTRMPQ